MAGFKSEWWPGSNRNGGRHQIGIPGRIASEFPHTSCESTWREAEEARASAARGFGPLTGLFDRHFALLYNIEEARPHDVDDAQWDVAMSGLRTFLATVGLTNRCALAGPKASFSSSAVVDPNLSLRRWAAHRRPRSGRGHVERDPDQDRFGRDFLLSTWLLQLSLRLQLKLQLSRPSTKLASINGFAIG